MATTTTKRVRKSVKASTSTASIASVVTEPVPIPEPVPAPEVSEPEPEPVTTPESSEPESDSGSSSGTETESLESQIEKLRSVVTSLNKDFNEKMKVFKAIDQDLKKLALTAKKELKKKHKKTKTNGTSKNAGFTPVAISEELATFLNLDLDTKIKPPTVTKLINEYANKHNLKHPENKGIFLPDDALKKLLGSAIYPMKKSGENGYDIFNLQKYMKPHFRKQEKV